MALSIRRWWGSATMVLAVCATALAAPAHLTPKAAAEPEISTVAQGEDDTFYTPPAGYEDTAPGTVLRSRPVVVKALELFPVRAQSWQLLYRTTDSDGNPYASVTTVMVPQGPARPRPLLSYNMAYDSMQRACMPSYSLVNSNPLDILDTAKESGFALPPMEFALTAAGLARGWAVSVPDASGVDNNFLTPRVMGYTVLDGIRAAENFTPLGLPGAATRTAMWGYSGGGITTDWAAELQPEYAPELNLAGAVLGAPVNDFDGALRAVNGRLLGGLAPIGVAALAKDSPELAATIDHYLTPQGRAVVAAAGRDCAPETVLKNLFRRSDQLMIAPMDQVLADPALRAALRERARGFATPTTPLYVVNGLNDEVSPIAAVDDLVAGFCAGGASVSYTRDALPDLVSDHTIIALTSAGPAMAWLDRVLAGQTPPPGCTTTTVASTLVDPAGLAALPGFAAALVQTMLGIALGAGH
ncbi:lipase family protein [Nocardia pseudobrasiliensis]|uniref:Secretory lipase n=1 Tax=Nocardia pseudobrasiliensis TaxID=45979 RepID=A0A370I8A0_9NOCA|nr:lipase family protein [Nocardia pseudobrasiliensis]RDI66351.1 secretory lipase [Nocardia pseudobrasiliensis]